MKKLTCLGKRRLSLAIATAVVLVPVIAAELYGKDGFVSVVIMYGIVLAILFLAPFIHLMID